MTGQEALAARWWQPAKDKNGQAAARCELCHHACLIAAGKSGWCGARLFDGQELRSPWLGLFSSIAVDPMEKKPLYHWRPGTMILSLGSLGCTMACPFCQNHSIARPGTPPPRLSPVSPELLRDHCLNKGLTSVAYTYNEPALQAEYILRAAPLLREAGIATVLVSNGMYSPPLLAELALVTEAANIDIKSFNSRQYARLGGKLDRVRATVAGLLQAGCHVECTTLVVPGVSDNEEEFLAEVDWLAALSPDIPLHLSRYRPAYKFTAPPTDIELLKGFAALARTRLRHVHIGNVPGLR